MEWFTELVAGVRPDSLAALPGAAATTLTGTASAFLLTSSLVFVAELGDKSQLLALAFAARYRWWIVLAALACATAIIQAIAVAAGQAIGAFVPVELATGIAGLLFAGFGIWTIREAQQAQRHHRLTVIGRHFGPFLMIAATFFVAELGDKTMLTALAISSAQQSFLAVWLGATAGMIAADAIAVAAGVFAGKRLSYRVIGTLAGLVFCAVGLVMLAGVVLPR